MSWAGLSMTATQVPRSTPCWSTTRAPIRSCTHNASSSSSASRGSAKQDGTGQLLGRGPVVDAVEANQPTLLLLTRLHDGEPLRSGKQACAGCKPLDTVGDQRNVQFAMYTVGAADAPDFAQWVSRQSRRRPRRHHEWRRRARRCGCSVQCGHGGRSPAQIAGTDLDLELQTVPALDSVDLTASASSTIERTTWVSTAVAVGAGTWLSVALSVMSSSGSVSG